MCCKVTIISDTDTEIVNIMLWNKIDSVEIIDSQKCHLIQCEIIGLLIHDPGITGCLEENQARSSTSYHMPK